MSDTPDTSERGGPETTRGAARGTPERPDGETRPADRSPPDPARAGEGSGSGSAGSVEYAEAPTALDLIRLSPRLLFPPGGRELYRQIALLVELSPEDEVIIAGCGKGVTLEYYVTDHGAHGQGVDVDHELIAEAEERARERGLAGSMQFQQARMDRLPYKDAIFDVAIGELGMTHGADPGQAVRELVRVTRPGGSVVLVQPVWKAPVDEGRREALSSYLGVRPLMLVEWKRLLLENGVEHLHTEDWSDEETSFRPQVVKPFPDFADLFSPWEKLGILRRAWSRWGWAGVVTAIRRERAVRRLLTRERILGLDLLKGVRTPVEGEPQEPAVDAADEPSVDDPEEHEVGSGGADASDRPPGPRSEPSEPDPATEGLPLFSSEDEDRS